MQQQVTSDVDVSESSGSVTEISQKSSISSNGTRVCGTREPVDDVDQAWALEQGLF